MMPRSLLILGMLLAFTLPATLASAEDSDAATQSDKDAAKKKSMRKARSRLKAAKSLQASPRVLDKTKDSTKDEEPEDEEDSEAESTSRDSDSSDTSDKASKKKSSSGKKKGDEPRKVLPSFDKNVRIHIDYDGTDIKDVIKDFAEKTGRNFLIDPKIKGKITIIAPNPVSIDEAYEAFLAALDAAGFTTVVEARFSKGANRGKPMLTRILSAADARSEPLELYKGGYTPKNANLITRLIQVQNISVDEISKVIQKWVSKNGQILAYAPSNTLILTDSANNIRRILDLIQELDISAPKQKLDIIPVEFAEAAKIVEIIREIYGDSVKSKTSATKTKAGRKTKKKGKATAASSASVGKETAFIGKMLSDDRTNSIIVLATESSLDEIRKLVERLDYETDPFAQSDIHVIYLEHAKAEELSQTLNNLAQQSNQRAQKKTRAKGKKDKKGAKAKGGALSGNFQGEVRVSHDAPTNALVVTAAREDFRRMRKVIDLLDIPRKQVFVETVIMEISDSVRRDAGASWHGGKPGEGETGINVLGARGAQSVNLGSALLDGSLLGGLALGVFGQAINVPLPGIDGGLEIPAFGLVLRALQEDSSTNVLSSPNILTLDNEEATIEIGETVPFPTGGSLGALAGAAGAAAGFGGFPSISFSREDVGIILRLTPQINESDYVTMEIYQEISEVKEGSTSDTLSSGGPTTTKRSADTHINVRSNQTIVIGGLMQEVETESESKVPILGDIPLLGFFFRNKAKTKRKTNLLIFLTPHVIDSPEDLQEVYRIKMLQRQEFIRRFYGKTKEEQLAELNELIRYSMNIPDSPSVYRDREPRQREHSLGLGDLGDGAEQAELREALEELDTDQGEVLVTPEGEVSLDDEVGAETEDKSNGEQEAETEKGKSTDEGTSEAEEKE
ncbi:MAG TPA: type II secretion system protein GspD [Deltaproteobacteria bacterium]|nr:type II secretion system protein GspD [Deltaproteobacteria bacterium]HCP44787.1 type II secretion system protein GspD [Deltaproteobacteria bacterium]